MVAGEVKSLANQTSRATEEIANEIARDRLVDLKKDPRLVYGMVFGAMGASSLALVSLAALAASLAMLKWPWVPASACWSRCR